LKKIKVQLPEDVIKTLEEAAKERGLKRSELIREIVVECVERDYNNLCAKDAEILHKESNLPGYV
jgi:metal-responsive CopG/Arc/MetJ family transcriptional regulator